MRIFAFGLGYTAQRVLARLPGVEASGATRDAETARVWRRDGVAAWAVGDEAGRPALEAALRGAETLLVSAPPDENGDPALQRFGGTIAAAPALARVVYLSSVGVYGDCNGARVDELSASEGAVGVFNLFNSLLAGVAVFIGGYAFGRWVTTSDPAFLRILAKSERYKLRYDAAKQNMPRVEVL